MPLHTGGNKAVSYNIHELTHYGKRKRSHKQIVAIAINAAHKARHNQSRTNSGNRYGK